MLSAEASPEAPQTRELKEVLNYVTAAMGAFAWIRDYPRITTGLLEQVHGVLVRGTDAENDDAGRIRRTPVAIGSPDETVEGARFVPMPHGTSLNVAVQALVDWIGDENAARDPLVAAGLAHYQFETLHPFNDGNGRIGRLLIVLQLMTSGLVSQPLLSVSPWFETRRAPYQERLAEVSATGDWDGWLRFFAEGVEASAVDTARRVDRLLWVQQRYVEAVLGSGSRGGVVRDIAEFLIGSPWVTVPQLSKRFGRTQQAVNTAVMRLVELGVVLGPIGNYNRRFLAQDVWDTLRAPMGRVPEREAPLRRDRP